MPIGTLVRVYTLNMLARRPDLVHGTLMQVKKRKRQKKLRVMLSAELWQKVNEAKRNKETTFFQSLNLNESRDRLHRKGGTALSLDVWGTC